MLSRINCTYQQDAKRSTARRIVEGDRWDTFFRFPPCGTVAEIESTLATVPDKQDLKYLAILMENRGTGSVSSIDERFNLPQPGAMTPGQSGEIIARDTQSLACVQCHMPLVENGPVRHTRQHLWRGGHNPEMVKNALTIDCSEEQRPGQNSRVFQLTITNTGAAHYVPTGTPDRHLTVHLRALDKTGVVTDEHHHSIKRTVMWRPFIVDLWDNRLARWQPRRYELEVAVDSSAVRVQAEISYHLLAESRRKRIGYESRTPINYSVFREQIALQESIKGAVNE